MRWLMLAGFAMAPLAAHSAPSGNAKHGQQLFLTVGCSECHGTAGQGGAGPHLATPHPLPAAVIRAYIRDPAGQMPPYAASVLSDADIADIAAYLQSIPDPPKLSAIPELSN
jgi:mono/diheme cytochrome c family protein